MGSDKCLLEIDGVSCIQRVAMTLAEAGLEPIRISVASPEHMERYGRALDSSLQIEWIVDSSPYAGPIEAILDALSDPFCNDPLQIAPVDVPWLEMDLLIGLEQGIGSRKVAMPVCSGRTHPLLALVRPEIVGLIGSNRRPLREQFQGMDHVLIEVREEVVRNLNEPSDLE
tara:strand:- start:427 stop:939 length:513 start_codon:yes stop_codon:yes gene_type:complete